MRNVTQQMTNIQGDDLNVIACSISDTLYVCAKSSLIQGERRTRADRMELGRWERLLNDEDNVRVWKAIA